MATWRRRAWVVVVGAVALGSSILSELYYRTAFPGPPTDRYVMLFSVLIGVTAFAAVVATGYYIGTRRELVASLQEQVATADREAAQASERARDAERTRIAREMHDVLAHRISLVALHAGALAYRDDLTREETRETAQTIQANAQLALSELRQVLGVLRAGRGRGRHRTSAAHPGGAARPARRRPGGRVGRRARHRRPGRGAPPADPVPHVVPDRPGGPDQCPQARTR